MRSPRPRDAATLILVRHLDSQPEVLMGQRTTRDAWTDRFVFPGGRVDPSDSRVPTSTDLRPEVAARLLAACTPARARALAVAAIRETQEETGLLFAKKALPGETARLRQSSWRSFSARGMAPALDELHLLCRAVTPPRRPKRFNARFFVADAEHAEGVLGGNGELRHLSWFTLEQADDLPLPLITQAVLAELARRLERARGLETPPRIPLFRTVRGRHQRLFE